MFVQAMILMLREKVYFCKLSILYCRDSCTNDSVHNYAGTSGITDVCCCNHAVQLAGPIIAVNRPVDTSNNTPVSSKGSQISYIFSINTLRYVEIS